MISLNLMLNIVLIFLQLSWAQEKLPVEITLGGEVDFYFEASQSPSSKTGQTAFEFSRLELLPTLKMDEQISFCFRFDLAEERSATQPGYQTKTENAYLEWKPLQNPSLTHQLGLIRPQWRISEGSIADFDNFGDSSKNLSRRYKFLSDGDLGYQGLWQRKENQLVAFGVLNGEENKTEEMGPSKEVFAGTFYGDPASLWSAWLSYGRVDQVEDPVSERVRGLLRHQKQWGRFRLGLEFLWAQDGNADFEARARGEGMTFTELTEPRAISTQASRIEIYYVLNPLQQILLRYDDLQTEISGKNLTSTMLAWVKSEPQLFDWGFFYENTLYGQAHSAQSRQIERLRLGLSKVF
jgi:hypothetical protein